MPGTLLAIQARSKQMGTTSSALSSVNGNRGATSSRPAGFRAIADNFSTLDQVQSALRTNGLESSNLIVAVDFTKSNEWTGRQSFGGRSLHWVGHESNPYEQAISIIARTLAAFDDDGLIPGYGFGDTTTADQAVFSFFPGDQPACGLDALVMRYKELIPHVRLAGPTSFAPAIYQAMKIVVESGNQYHILLLIADGQVTRSVDMPGGQASNQERATINAIVEASQLPLSIVMVGVGDGPWDQMQEFDDMLPQRRFDNFQFVSFTDITRRYAQTPQRMEAMFATNALMEIPEQFKIIQRLNILGSRMTMPTRVRCLDPPGPPSMAPGAPAYVSYPSFNAGAAPSYPPYGAPPPGAMQYPAPGQMPAYGYPPQPGPCGPPHGMSYPPYQMPADPVKPSTSAAPAPGPSAGDASSSSGAGPSTSPGVDPTFVCPISHEVMKEPVVAADGHTYDRASITQWLSTHDTSPMTGAKLPHKELTPNHALHSMINNRTGP